MRPESCLALLVDCTLPVDSKRYGVGDGVDSYRRSHRAKLDRLIVD